MRPDRDVPRHLLELSHDELSVVFDGLADPLQPAIAVALSSSCLGLRTPLLAALKVLAQQHSRALALCHKVGMSCCAELRGVEYVDWHEIGLIADDMAMLALILRTNALPELRSLCLHNNGFGDAGMLALCEGMGRGAHPSLNTLVIGSNVVGLAGAEAVAAVLSRGMLPRLEILCLSVSPFGNEGMAALSPALRSLPRLKYLGLANCDIGDEGVASLVADLDKDDFKALEKLWLKDNKITDAGVTQLVAVINSGGLAKLSYDENFLACNLASASAVHAYEDALTKRSQMDTTQ